MVKIVKRRRIKKGPHWYKFHIDRDYHGPHGTEQRVYWWNLRKKWFEDHFPKAHQNWFQDRATADEYVAFCKQEMEHERVMDRLAS